LETIPAKGIKLREFAHGKTEAGKRDLREALSAADYVREHTTEATPRALAVTDALLAAIRGKLGLKPYTGGPEDTDIEAVAAFRDEAA
jgi:hypothetical protein